MESKKTVKDKTEKNIEPEAKRGRCLIVLHRFWPFLGGSEKQFLKWAEILDERGYKVRVYTTNVWDNDYFYLKEKRYIKERTAKIGRDIKIRRFRVSHFPNKNAVLHWISKFPSKIVKFLLGSPYIFLPGYYLFMIFSALFSIKKFDFVIAGVFPHYYLIYPAYLYAKIKKIPFILCPLVHFGQPNSDENFELFFNEKSKFLLKKSDYILTITNEEKQKLVEEGIDSSKIRVSGIGIEEKVMLRGKGARFKKKYRISSPYVLQISTQTHDKGSHHIVEAMKVLWRRRVDIKLVLIGQILSEFEHYLLAQKKLVFENTIILSYGREEDKNDAIEGCSVFAMPSKSDSFGLVFLEAWLHKKPVVAAYCSGVNEVIDEGINGFLVPFGDYEMLAGYILKLVENRELADNMGQAGYEKTLNNYLWDQRLKNFNSLIDTIERDRK